MVSKWWPLGQLTAMSTPQYLSYQCPCPVSESQTLPISWEILQDQQVGLAQAPRKSLLFPLVPVCTRLCVCPPRLMFVSPNPAIEPCWPSKPRLESLAWGSDLSFLWENLGKIMISQFMSHPLGGNGA